MNPTKENTIFPYYTAIGVSLAVLVITWFAVSSRQKPTQPSLLPQPEQNVFQHHVSNPKATETAIKRAWIRFQHAQGNTPRTDGKPTGLSEKEIEALEQGMCQRLPEDLKVFLKIYRSHGDQFLDLNLLTNDEIVGYWHDRASLGVDTYNVDRFILASHGQPFFWDPWVFPIASEHLDDLGFDLRNGKMMETIDCDSGWIAGSLVELLDAMSEQFENGKIIARYYPPVDESYHWKTIEAAGDKLRKQLLDAAMWNIYPVDPTQVDIHALEKGETHEQN